MAKRKGKAQGLVVRAGASAASGTKKEAAPPAAAAAAAAAATAVVSDAPSRRKKKRRVSSTKAVKLDDLPDEEIDGLDETQGATEAAFVASSSTAAASSIPGAPVRSVRTGAVVSGGAVGLPPPSPWSLDGRESADELLSWFLWPLTPAEFFAEYWEKKPLHLRRSWPEFYADLFSKADVDKLLRTKVGLPYGEHLNLVRFDETKQSKVELNRGGRGIRAAPEDVDAAWASGSSLQVMHPQQYHEPVWRLLAALERGFSSLFGANAYLTPSGSQGFPPHFDDVEVFMLQLEGSKHWRLHAPPEGEEYPLPRSHSRDFKADELGELLLDCILEKGDLLYLPRGTAYAELALDGAGFSHHLSVSTYQRTSWFQVLERGLSSALEKAAGADAEFRAGLPLGFLRFMGTWSDCGGTADNEVISRRGAFSRRFKSLLKQLEEFIDLDDVCDEFGVDFTAQRLPPPAAGSRHTCTDAPKTLTNQSRVRWVDPSAVRLVLGSEPEGSEPTVLLFHSCSNARRQHMCRPTEGEEDVGCLRFEASTFLSALRRLHAIGATSICVGDLPLADEDDRIALCENLCEAGVLEVVDVSKSDKVVEKSS